MGLMVLASELFMMMINVCVQGAGRRWVSMQECVYVRMMMMNGGLHFHALPMSTACKHKEMIRADTLSCSLMQLYILSTR